MVFRIDRIRQMGWSWMMAVALFTLFLSFKGALADGVTPEEARELRDEVVYSDFTY